MTESFIKKKSGTILILVIGMVVLSAIIFVSVVDRVRRESALTNRVSLNERLYQLSSAVGRIAIRKLQGDLETREEQFAQDILDAVFIENKTGRLDPVDYSSVIRRLDVIADLKSRFAGEWGSRGRPQIRVRYVVDLGEQFPFSEPIAGIINCSYERKGEIQMMVEITSFGITKTNTISKSFFLTRLLAPPFYRFTLFAHNGANLNSEEINKTYVNALGNMTTEAGNTKPLVLLNRRIRNKRMGQPNLDTTRATRNQIVYQAGGGASYIRSGWIYLGGYRGPGDNLNLNIKTGRDDDNGSFNRSFGEGFLLYFHEDSLGWYINLNWSDYLENRVSGNSNPARVRVSRVDYGFHDAIWGTTFPPGGNYLFRNSVRAHPRGNEMVRGGRAPVSSINLFGTPSFCTPTLVFGRINRRYIKTQAFMFPEFNRVYAIRRPVDDIEMETLINEAFDYYINFFGGQVSANVDALIDNIKSFFADNVSFDLFTSGSQANNLPRLSPIIVEEPYMESLINIIEPGNPHNYEWSDIVKIPARNMFAPNSPQQLQDDSFVFHDDHTDEIRYRGSINTLRVNPERYLRDRVTYYIDNNESEINLSQCSFFNENFTVSAGNNKYVYLNQVIAYSSDIVIDEPLQVAKGGIIISDGTITIRAPVIDESQNTPDMFGQITFVAHEGIRVQIPTNGSDRSIIHAFLISMNDNQTGSVQFYNPVHLIGGIAQDSDIRNLLDSGSIIEWAFDPNEQLASDMSFYGLSFGPTDIEVVKEN